MNDREVGTSGGLCSRSRRDPWVPGPGTAGAPLRRPLSRGGEKGGVSPGGRGPSLPHVELRVCTVHGPVHPPYTRMIGTLVTAAQGEEPSQPRVKTEDTFSSQIWVSSRTSVLQEPHEFLYNLFYIPCSFYFHFTHAAQ